MEQVLEQVGEEHVTCAAARQREAPIEIDQERRGVIVDVDPAGQLVTAAADVHLEVTAFGADRECVELRQQSRSAHRGEVRLQRMQSFEQGGDPRRRRSHVPLLQQGVCGGAQAAQLPGERVSGLE